MSTLTIQQKGYKVDLRPAARSLPVQFTPKVSTVLEAIKCGAKATVEFCGRHRVIIRAGALAVALTVGFGMEEVLAAADPGLIGDAAATGGPDPFDTSMRRLYYRLIRFGKWAAIIKGAFETISKTLEGDWIAARKSGLLYLLVYVILLGLPWLFDRVDEYFMGSQAPIGGVY